MAIPSPAAPPTNSQAAEALDRAAVLLEEQGANPFRVRAYREAARTVRELPEPLAGLLVREGLAGLLRLPSIGQSLGRALEHYVATGHMGVLDRLEGSNSPERRFATVAYIGPKLGERIHEELGIETLAELRAAAQDGRLARIPGMGPKRLRSIRESLAGRFARTDQAHQPPPAPADTSVSVGELLDIDREYREGVRHRSLPRIAPLRFNPTSEAWLPVLHTRRGDRFYTALFSNTARAHELGATRDWVVIYRDDPTGDGRWTVITSAMGKLAGRRVVAGREPECAAWYAEANEATG